MDKLSKIVAVALALLIVVAVGSCEQDEANGRSPVTAIVLDEQALTLMAGTEGVLEMAITPAIAADQAVWSSSDESYATVDKTGRITAIREGKVTIFVKAGGKVASCELTITGSPVLVTEITLDKETLVLAIGDKATLIPALAPAGATDKTVKWASSAPTVAKVDENSGEITALTLGSAVITATAGDLTATCTVTVSKEVPVTQIVLSKEELLLGVTEEYEMGVTLLPANATNKVVAWTSSDPEVAIVHPIDGTIFAVKAGTATITAKTGELTATCVLTVVTAIPVESITLNKTTLSMVVGDDFTIEPTFTPANATNKTAKWTSSNDEKVTVDATGKVHAVAAGTATITATAGEHSETCVVTVVAAAIPITGISTYPYGTLKIGTNTVIPFEYEISPSNATDQHIAWASSDPTVATVDEKGVLTSFNKIGTTTLTATAGSKTTTVEISVVTVTAISISPAKITLDLDTQDSDIDVTTVPSGVYWKLTSSNPAVVSCYDYNGTISGNKKGKATITATAGGQSATSEVTVKDFVMAEYVTIKIPKTKLKSEEGVMRMELNETYQLKTTIEPANATYKDLTWWSSDPSKVTVDAYGNVTAVGITSGPVVINVMENVNENGDRIDVYVSPQTFPAESISLNETAITLYEGRETTLTASVLPTNTTDPLIWKSMAASTATVDENGKITAKKSGIAIITATIGKQKASCTVTVKPVPVTLVAESEKLLTMPAGMASTENGVMYVANYGGHTIFSINTAGVLGWFAGDSNSNMPGYKNGSMLTSLFNEPIDVAVDVNGTIYVADAGNNCIRKIEKRVVSTLAGHTVGTDADNPGAPTFSYPSGVAVDKDGTYLFVADTKHHTIRRVTCAEGETHTIAGSTQGSDNGNGAMAKFKSPTGIAVWTSGSSYTIYVADHDNGIIRKIVHDGNFDKTTNTVTTLAGNGTWDSVDGTGTAASFNGPYALSLSADGKYLYVTELEGQRIRKIRTSTGVVTTVTGHGTGSDPSLLDGKSNFVGLRGITVSPKTGYIYVSDSEVYSIKRIVE